MEQKESKQIKKRGGRKGRHWKLTEETKRRIGNARRGTHLSEETKKKIRNHWTPERRKQHGLEHSGKNNPMFGKTWTPEHRAKIKKAIEKIAISWSPEKIERIKKIHEIINSPRPTCQKCGIIIKRHNKNGMCQKHKKFSTYIKERAKIKYLENREEIRRYSKEYIARPEVKAKKQVYDMEYRKRNAKKIDARVLDWRKKRINNDPLFRFKERLKKRIYSAFKSIGLSKPNRSMTLLGASLQEIKKHIEFKFREGMTWDNYGKWHADHIIPISSAKTKDEMIKLCHYTNLQPLWALDNLRKGKKIENRP